MLEAGMVMQGRYRILDQIGRGGMGTVYLARDENLGVTVAVKRNVFDDDRLIEAFKREARLLAGLRHSSLPQVKDYFINDAGQFLVMEYISGDDFGTILEKRRQKITPIGEAKPFEVHEVVPWAEQLLDALDYLHTLPEPVIHRDIKPQNLKLAGRNQIILLDFGLAKGKPLWMTRVTTTGSIYGYTPNYAPLEQIRGVGTDPRSDLYALGATLYHLITGVPPVDAATRADAFIGGDPEPLPAANEVNPQVPREIALVLMKAMAQHRNKRPASAAEMLEMLRAAKLATVMDGSLRESVEVDAHQKAAWAVTEVELRRQAEAAQKAQEEAERQQREEEARKAQEEVESKRRIEQERHARQEAARRARSEAAALKAQREREESERRAAEAAVLKREPEPKAREATKRLRQSGSKAKRAGEETAMSISQAEPLRKPQETLARFNALRRTKKELLRIGALIGLIALIVWAVEIILEITRKSDQPPASAQAASNQAIPEPRVLKELMNGFVQIPAGDFMMGSEDGDDNEKPIHRVRISRGFEIGKYEVSQMQWEAVMGNNPSHFKGADLPVENVSWDDAQEFIQRLNAQNDGYVYRLPTEAEWEYACRAGSTGDYANNLAAMAWYDKNSGEVTHPVGTKQPNALGLYDIYGNVWEWCQDWYNENYYVQSSNVDPQGPTLGSARVERGGSLNRDAQYLRSASRYWGAPGNRSFNLGFRLVRTPR